MLITINRGEEAMSGRAAGAPETPSHSRTLPFMTRFRPGIGVLLLAGIVTIAVAVMAVTTYLDINARRSDARAALLSRANGLATTAGSVLDQALRDKNVPELRDLAQVFWSQPDIAYVNIFAADGERLIGPLPDSSPPRGTVDPEIVASVSDLFKRSYFRGQYLEVVSPVDDARAPICRRGAVRFRHRQHRKRH